MWRCGGVDLVEERENSLLFSIFMEEKEGKA